MTNYLEDAFAPVERDNHDRVLSQTWGHLHPERDRYYEGYMVFAYGAYGDMVIVQDAWDGLNDSPWLHDDMTEYWQHLVHEKCLEDGHIYRFDGQYVCHMQYDPEELADNLAQFQGEKDEGLWDKDAEFSPEEWGMGEIGIWEFIGSYSEVRY